MSKVTDTLESLAVQAGQGLYQFGGHTPRPVVARRATCTRLDGAAKLAAAAKMAVAATISSAKPVLLPKRAVGNLSEDKLKAMSTIPDKTAKPIVDVPKTAVGAVAMTEAAKMAGAAKLSSSKPVLMPKRAAVRQSKDKLEPMSAESAIPDKATKPIADAAKDHRRSGGNDCGGTA